MINPSELQDLKQQVRRFYAVSNETAIALIDEIQSYHEILCKLASERGVGQEDIFRMSPREISELIPPSTGSNNQNA